MAPSSSESTWFPSATPREVASTVVASVQHVTSSVRLLLVGCFQCRSLRIGCWKRQEEPDGAWFDCDKLQVEHPFCYVNPVALAETPQPLAVSSPPLPAPQPKPPDTSPNLKPPEAARNHKPPVAAPTGKPSKALHPLPRRAGRGSQGGVEVHSRGLRDDGSYKNGGIGFKTGTCDLVESFAAKLEADLKKLEYDRQRSEGELVLTPKNYLNPAALHVPSYLEADPQHDPLEGPRDVFSDFEKDQGHEDEFGDVRVRLEDEVWRPEELEDVFEGYNLASFYSYGSPTSSLGSPKHRGEKYEEIFPISFHNNNTIKVYKPQCESDLPLALLKDLDTTENGLDSDTPRKRSVNQDQLKEFINICIRAENFDSVVTVCVNGMISCADVLNYRNKSFNKHLIFDLVKSVMSECSRNYTQSIAVSVKYPTHLVQSKVLAVLEEEDTRNEVVPSGVELFRNNTLLSAADAQFYQNQIVTERLIENLVIDELRTEDKLWQDVSQEESELKEAITAEILDDLIGDTASLFKSIFNKKLT